MAKYKMVTDGMPVFEGDEYWDSERGWLPVVPYYGHPAPRGTLVRRPTKRAPDAGESAASQALSPQSGEFTPEANHAAIHRQVTQTVGTK